MSVHDRTTQTAARRFLGRALVLAGTAVAGTSSALLIGQPAEAEPEEPAPLTQAPLLADAAALTDDAGLANGTALADAAELPATSLGQVDPASFPLDRVDPLTLVPDEPVGHLLTGDLEEETAEPAGTPQGTEPATSPEPAAGPDRQADVPRAVADTPVPAPEPSASSPQVDGPVRVTGRSAPASPGDTPEPEFPRGNSTLPASTGCAKTADGQQPGTGLPGWYPAAPRADGARPDACAPGRDEVLRGVPAPQPGATPD
ncbi:hypothetical protein [Saccharopolyspora mangrovi]|uniref:Secreted protein n=1 Tax=Saccharopolyspora mangrovi TaxID=3082379 RepID=A0ABU6AGR9_9PSEU|nr:hypothetical protein [Saccharopolyspora sp. S2-29]MEB3370751.1 hypothetical protein [Saccharopolyspora sp. S2-29]